MRCRKPLDALQTGQFSNLDFYNPAEPAMQPVQIKMARAALGLSPDDLAKQAGVDGAAVTALEGGREVEGDVLSALNLFLSTHGIELIEGDGVRARASSAGDFVPIGDVTTANDGGIS